MGNIKISHEELMRISNQFINDKVICLLTRQLNHILSISIPNYVLTENPLTVTATYDHKTMEIIKNLEKERKSYIAANYSPEVLQSLGLNNY